MKRFLIIGLTLVALLVLAGGVFWWFSIQPLYRPGMVRAEENLRAPLTPPVQPGNPDYWQVEKDIRLYHFSHGQGRNVLVIHGGPGMPFRQPLTGLEPLTANYHFYYYDQRGCGLSTRPFDRFVSSNLYANMTSLDQALGLGAQIADIERIRRILGDEKLILIGHSWGGFLASLYAVEFPERVEALILVSPATALVMPQTEADLFTTVRQRLPEAKRAEYDAFIQDYMDFNQLFTRSESDLIALNARFGEYYVSVVPSPEAMPKQGEPGGWMSWGMYVSLGQAHDYRAALKSVIAPVLVLHGAQDLQSEAASRQYADLFPNAQFEVVRDASHFSFEEQPRIFAQTVEKFLARLP